MSALRRRSEYTKRTGGHVLVVFLLFFSFSSTLIGETDGHALKELAKLCQHTTTKSASFAGKLILKAGTELSKASIYPIWAFGKGGTEYYLSKEPSHVSALKEVLKNRWDHDKGALVIASALWALQQTTGITVNQYHKLTSDFDKDDGEEGIVVVIDDFGDDLLYRGAGDYVYRRLHKPVYGDKVFFLKDIPLDEIPAALKKLAKEHGPIKKVDYYGHGLVGMTVCKGIAGTVSDLVGSSSHYPGSPIAPYPNETELPLDPQGWYRDLFETKLEKGIFGKNAKIRFNSCFIGNGPEGELFTKAIANSWLRDGGTVYNSKVQIFPSLGEIVGLRNDLFIPPQGIRSITDHLTPIRGAVTAFTLLYEIPYYRANSHRVERPFLTPGSRVRIVRSPGESPLRDKFEKAWLSGMDYNKVHELYGPSDIKHYAPLRAGTPRAVADLPIRNEEEWGGTDPSLRLKFKDQESAKEYISYLNIDRELLEEPKIEESTIIIKQKPKAKEVLDKRVYDQQLLYATKAKENLKTVYEEEKKFSPKEAKRHYEEYLGMLPLYMFKGFMDHDLPKDPALYKKIDEMKKP